MSSRLARIAILSWIVTLVSATCVLAASSRAEVENEALANWHMNYASYLIDVGKYMQALENYDTVFELSKQKKLQAHSLLGKASVMALFLDAPDKAAKVYEAVTKEYPQYGELALFRLGLLYSELKKPNRAKEYLRKYQSLYPGGQYRFQAEALLQTLGEAPPSVPPAGTTMEPTPPELRIRLCRKARSVTVRARTGQQICVEGAGCAPSVTVKPSKSGVSLLGHKLSEARLTSSAPMTVVCGKKEKVVRGNMRISNYSGRLLGVNFIEIESYLRSVVPAESYASWPLETLKAQAVAARTYAYYQKLHRSKRPYDMVDNEGDQAYAGTKRERASTDKAVSQTRGQILVHKGRPILAMYSANSGGYTAEAAAVFDMRKEYLIAHPDPESLKGKMATWTRRYSRVDIEYKLNRIGIREKGLRNIVPVKTGPSGRIIKVRLQFDTGSRVFRTRTTLRRALKLPDILFKIIRDDDKYIFEGGGYGHGVGYSQWGSAVMGKWKPHVRILEFYYPGTRLERRWR